MTITKQKRQVEFPIDRWLRRYDFWLSINYVSLAEAVELAREDGIVTTKMRLTRACSRACKNWLHNGSGERVRQRKQPELISANAWGRIMDELRDIHPEAMRGFGTVAVVKSYLKERCGINQPIPVIREALKAMGFYKPDRTDRVKFAAFLEQ